MPTKTGAYSDDRPRLNRQGSERADEAGNATNKPVGRELAIDDLHTEPGSAALPKNANK